METIPTAVARLLAPLGTVLRAVSSCGFITTFINSRRDTPCTESAYDRARRFETHRTPCTESADDRARRMSPHRTPCTESADDRARRMSPHRTPCTECVSSRADKRCTPCSSTDTLPRARMAPSGEGLSSASSPCSTRAPSPQPRRPHLGAPYSRSAAKSLASTLAPRPSAPPVDAFKISLAGVSFTSQPGSSGRAPAGFCHHSDMSSIRRG